MKLEQKGVPKCRQIKFKRRGITQKKEYNNLLFIKFIFFRPIFRPVHFSAQDRSTPTNTFNYTTGYNNSGQES
jgi:hypothetical protein